MNPAQINSCMIAGDDTVRMRHLSDGTLQILSIDGKMILEEISKESMDRAAARAADHDEDGLDTIRGFMIGMFVSSVLWVGILLVTRWLTA